MQTIDKMAEELLKAINQIIPSVTSDEKYTAAQVCVVALYHAEVAISERRDHLRARQCLFALTSFRELAKRVSNGLEVDLLDAGYTCAAALKRNKIDEAKYINEMIERLGRLLPEKTRTSDDKWVDDRSTDLPRFRPANDDDGWTMVQLMLDGKTYGTALLALHERDVLMQEINQFLQSRNDQNQNQFSGKPLPNFGSLVIGPNHASAHFGPGGGSVTLIDGKLSVILPSSGRR
jgi:hypothetical protein